VAIWCPFDRIGRFSITFGDLPCDAFLTAMKH
jgi:hypothetical protein